MNNLFQNIARHSSDFMATSTAFIFALIIILVWIITGPVLHFSDLWQLIINTGTNIITFLMIFLLQNTQNRDTEAIHLKLDEIIRSIEKADNKMISIEDLSDDQIEKLKKKFDELK